jgi:ABC-type branched-subunit amino acid transport system substrate-binding protein
MDIRIQIRPQGDSTLGANGFYITLSKGNEEFNGYLPPLTQGLKRSMQDWLLSYYGQEEVRSYCYDDVSNAEQILEPNAQNEPEGDELLLRATPGRVVRRNVGELRRLTDSVKEELNLWLEPNARWIHVHNQLFAIGRNTTEDNSVQIILDFPEQDILLKRLPWREWNLLTDHYPKFETPLKAYRNSPWQNYPYPESSKIRILVIIGESKIVHSNSAISEIDLSGDLAILTDLQVQDSRIEIILLEQPTQQQLQEKLEDPVGYHILVYSGHSRSQLDGQIGFLLLNSQESPLAISDFRENLSVTIRNGLKLAIFNSCDGLGMARQIADLQLPQCIVMREPVPNEAAVEFLRRFFEQFARQDKSLIDAVRIARRGLEALHRNRFPGVMWLPTICIKPGEHPLTWQMLVDQLDELEPPETSVSQPEQEPSPDPRVRLSRVLKIMLLILVGLAVAIFAHLWLNRDLIPTYAPNQNPPNLSASISSYKETRNITITDDPSQLKNDPAKLSALLNAIIDNQEPLQKPVYKVGVVLESNENDAQVFRGVVQAQLKQNCDDNVQAFLDSLGNETELLKQCSKGNFLLHIDPVPDKGKVTVTQDDLREDPTMKTPKKIADDFHKLGVAAVIGHSNSGTTFAAYDNAYKDNGIVLISPTSTANRKDSNSKREHLLRTATNDAEAASDIVEYLSKKIWASSTTENKEVTILHQEEGNDVYNASLKSLLEEKLKSFKVSQCLIKDFNSSSCSPATSSTSSDRVLVIIANTDSVEMALDAITTNSKLSTPYRHIIGGDTLYEDIYNKKRNPTPEQRTKERELNLALNSIFYKQGTVSFAVTWQGAEDENEQSDFEKEAQKLWGGGINWRTVTAYDAVKILTKVLSEEKDLTKVTRKNLQSSVKSIVSYKSQVEGAVGKIEFDKNGDRFPEKDKFGVIAELRKKEEDGKFYFKKWSSPSS